MLWKQKILTETVCCLDNMACILSWSYFCRHQLVIWCRYIQEPFLNFLVSVHVMCPVSLSVWSPCRCCLSFEQFTAVDIVGIPNAFASWLIILPYISRFCRYNFLSKCRFTQKEVFVLSLKLVYQGCHIRQNVSPFLS